MTHATLKICYEVWEAPFWPFHKRKTEGILKNKIKHWSVIKKAASHLLQAKAPMFFFAVNSVVRMMTALMNCESSRQFLFAGSEHLLSTNVFYTRM